MNRLVLALAALLLMATAAEAQQPLVGVIRFDAWPSNGPSVADQRVRNLDPNQWHSRIPFFGSETGTNSVTMNENLQSVIDQELAYSVAAGIKFWCFNHLTTELHGAISAYMTSTSPNKPLVKICMQEGGLGTARIADTIAIMNAERTNYLTTPGGRPVFFLQTFFGLIDAAGVTALRNAVVAASFPNPYLICQHDTAAAVVNDANAVGCDAISSYPAAGHQVSAGNPYSDLVTKTQTMWDQWEATGRKVIPFVTAGWDVRPDDAAGNWWQMATPSEIATHLQAALTWSAAHPAATTEHNLIHIFAWNEIGEGGWLLPSNPATNPVGTGRLDAIAAVLNGTAPQGQWIFCANEGQACVVPTPTQVRYGANGIFLTQQVAASIACTNAAFGGDPVPGVAKTCAYSATLPPGFPTTALLDSGVGPNQNPIASGWQSPISSIHGPLQRSANTITGITDGVAHSSYWTVQTFGPDVEVFTTLAALPASGGGVFLYLRVNNPGSATATGYAVNITRDGAYAYFRLDNGVLGVLAPAGTGAPLAVGDQIGAVMMGNRLIIATKRGAGAWTAIDAGVVDSTYTGPGFIGMRIQTDTTRVTNFSGGTANVITQPTAPNAPSNLRFTTVP